MNDFEKITTQLIEFRDKRAWQQFHNPKDLALALGIEAAELQECFLWKSADNADVEHVKEELADVFAYAFLMAAHYKFDIAAIIEEKIKKNALKYPVDRSKGNATKYKDLP